MARSTSKRKRNDVLGSGRQRYVASASSPSVLHIYWFPGTTVGWILFGTRILFASFIPVRAISSVVLWWMWGSDRVDLHN